MLLSHAYSKDVPPIFIFVIADVVMDEYEVLLAGGKVCFMTKDYILDYLKSIFVWILVNSASTSKIAKIVSLGKLPMGFKLLRKIVGESYVIENTGDTRSEYRVILIHS